MKNLAENLDVAAETHQEDSADDEQCMLKAGRTQDSVGHPNTSILQPP